MSIEWREKKSRSWGPEKPLACGYMAFRRLDQLLQDREERRQREREGEAEDPPQP